METCDFSEVRNHTLLVEGNKPVTSPKSRAKVLAGSNKHCMLPGWQWTAEELVCLAKPGRVACYSMETCDFSEVRNHTLLVEGNKPVTSPKSRAKVLAGSNKHCMLPGWQTGSPKSLLLCPPKPYLAKDVYPQNQWRRQATSYPSIVNTTRKRALFVIIRSYASFAFSSGYASVFGRISVKALKLSVASLSLAVPLVSRAI